MKSTWRIKIWIGLLCWSGCIPLWCQSPYNLDARMETALLGTGAVTLGTGMYLHFHMSVFTPEEVAVLDRTEVNRFDLPATYNYSIGAGRASDVLLTGSHILPLLFLTAEDTRSDFGKIAFLFGETLLLTEGITNVTKRITKRPRPYVYNELVGLPKKQTRHARYAFFSGHTSVTTANCFFTAKVFSDYFPDSKLKPFVWGAAITIPALTGYFRVAAGKHYATDVITGYIVGGMIGWLVPHLHRDHKGKHLSIFVGGNSSLLVYRF